ncbi:hypothetical protein RUND412_003964 [Rhizina undulata]
MNRPSIEIAGSGTSTLNDFPDMFLGDLNIPGQISTGQCRSQYGHNIQYPHPGNFVTIADTPGIPSGLPSDGNCVAPKFTNTKTPNFIGNVALPLVSAVEKITTAISDAYPSAMGDGSGNPVLKMTFDGATFSCMRD